MKKVALYIAGFLRNYQFFTRSAFYSQLTRQFHCDVFASVWEEDGYGSNATFKYTRERIQADEIHKEFGRALCWLSQRSFSATRPQFDYVSVQRLLALEPHVLEKYRSKFFCVKQLPVSDGYDVHFHIRPDVVCTPGLVEGCLAALDRFDANTSPLFTSADLYHRDGCFGDTFQIGSAAHMNWLRGFYDKLYDPAYLELDIPTVPERILEHYANEAGIAREQIPGTIELNRERDTYAEPARKQAACITDLNTVKQSDGKQMQYDIAYFLPVTFKGKYSERLHAFRKYGLLNRQNVALKVYLLCGPESVPDEFAPDTWPYPVEFVPSLFNWGGIKNYAFSQHITPEIANSAKWWYKIDDDSINDVAGTVQRLDADYDWTQPLYICGDYGGGLLPLLIDAIARSSHSQRILMENQRDKPLIHHERESSFLSGPCMRKIVEDAECQRFFDYVCRPVNDRVDCFGDQGWAVAARFVRVHQVDCMFTTQWPLVSNFSLFGGRFTHIHFVHPACAEWPLFLDMLERYSVPTE